MKRNHRHIPVEILIEIIKRINDLKSLIRLRSVSKAWKSLIDSKELIAAHTTFLISHPETQHHRLLVSYADLDDSGYKYVSFVDDDSFRHDQKVTRFPPKYFSFVDDDDSFRHDQKVTVCPPRSVGYLVGSSHGLFCLYDTKRTKMAVIWNPSIRKSVPITLPNLLTNVPYKTCVGFGVCPRTLDPKLVKINCIMYGKEYKNSGIAHQVEVFTLSSGSWRSPLSSNLPRQSISFGWSQAVVDGFIYWDASVTTKVNGKSKIYNLVMSFDLTSEEFGEHDLPDIITHYPDIGLLKVSKLRDSLAVIELTSFPDRLFYCAVWMMTGHGHSRSFKMAKLFTVDSPDDTPVFTAYGFTKSGAVIIEMEADIDDAGSKLAVYEPSSQQKNDIGIYGIGGLFFSNSYMETLLLLDQ